MAMIGFMGLLLAVFVPMTVSAEEPVSYIDADGVEQTTENYTVLTGNEDDIGSGITEKWYVVNSDIHFSGPLVLKGNVNIILVDGKTATFGSENSPIHNSYCILSDENSGVPLYNLKIYGQSKGTGALTIYHVGNDHGAVSVYVDEYYQYGGRVTVNNSGSSGVGLKTKGRIELNNSSLSVTSASGDAINSEDLVLFTNAKVTAKATGNSSCAIKSVYNISITNSEVAAEATGTGGCAIYSSDAGIIITDSKVTATGTDAGIKTYTENNAGTVTLSLSGEDDFVKASNYVTYRVDVSAGEYLTDGDGNLYGQAEITTLTDTQVSAIAGQKLIPAYGIGISNSIEHGTITASPNVFRKDTFSNLYKTVTLTVTPDPSYTLTTLTVTGNTSRESIQPGGSGNTRTFTMPEENVTVSATFTQPSVTYLDANGHEQTCTSYTGLAGGHATTLEGGWYAVTKNTTATYDGTLTLNGNVNLILEDGAKLYVGTESNPINGIGISTNISNVNSNGYNLTIYGQSTDAATAGTLKVYSSSNDKNNCGGISLTSATFTLNGGNVLVSSTGTEGNGIYGEYFIMNGGKLDASSTNHAAIYMYYDITIGGGIVSTTGYDCGLHAANGSVKINGGSVNASVTGTPGFGNPAIYTANGRNSATNTTNSITINGGNLIANSWIKANGTAEGEGSIILGYSNAADSIKADSYIPGDSGSIKVADGKCFTIDGTNAFSGTLTDDRLTSIAGQTLVPAYGVIIGNVTNGTVTASPAAFVIKDYANANKTVTLAVNPSDGYNTGIVKYNDGSDHVLTKDGHGEYSFTMPARNVTATATFPKSFDHNDITIDPISDQTYTGIAITPAVTVKDGGVTLSEGTDYTVSYENNINAASRNAANAPAVTITGKGDYNGSKEITFTISPAPIIVTKAVRAKTGLKYISEPQELALAGACVGGTIQYALGENSTTAPTDGWNMAIPTGISARSYYVWYRMKADQNHIDRSPDCLNVSISKATPAAPSGLYHENATSDTAADGVIYGVDTTMEYSTDNGANWSDVTGTTINGLGTGTVKVRVKGSLDVEYGAEATIMIGVTQPLTGVLISGTAKYGETLTASITPEGCAGMTYVWYRDGSVIDYETGRSYIVAAADIGKRISVKATQSSGGSQEIFFTSAETAVVTKADGDTNKAATPVLESVSKDTITVKALNGYEYRIGTDGDWQTSGEFTGLNAANGYSIYTRKCETQTQFAGAVSDALAVTTNTEGTVSTVGTLSDGTGTIVTESIIEQGVPATVISNLTASLAESMLTDTEKAAVQGGDKLTLTLDVRNVGHLAPDVDQILVENAARGEADNAVVGLYLNIILQKKIGNGSPVNVTDTHGSKISAVITVPDDLKNTDSTITRTFYIIRIHDNVAAILASTTADVIPFESDLFSTYALAYSDISNGSGGGDTPVSEFTVTFDLNGKPGMAPSAQTVNKDAAATKPADPAADGFTFTGWYTESSCETKYDFSAPVTADITLYAGWETSSEPEPEPEPVVIDECVNWNLYEDDSVHEFKIRGINVNGTVANSNAKSKSYYEASISGSTITVKVTGDRSQAASATNAGLEFDLGNAGVVKYTLPVSYVKPIVKLSSTSATIKSGTQTVLKTTLLVKNADGSFEPYDMKDVRVSGTGLGDVAKASDGSIEIRTSVAGKGKINIVKDCWDGAIPVSLAYTVKKSNKDVLSVDLQGLKKVVVNSNAKGQIFSYDVTINGAAPAEGAVTIADKSNTGLATITGGKLVIAYKDGVKKGNYTITLQAGDAKANVQIKVSDKALDKSITTKIQTKYDVVTRQGMVVIPKLNDVGGNIEAVNVAESGFSAKLDAAGNIVIDYSGDKYDAKNLKIGTLTLSLKISDIEDPVTLTLKNVKAKKTTPKVNAVTVTIPANVEPAEGKIIGTANIVSTYKVSSGMVKSLKPVTSEIVGTPKNVTAKVNDNDRAEIDIYSISKKKVSFKVKLTYAGGVTKTVTVKVVKK